MKANYSKHNVDIHKIQLAPYKTIICNFLSLSGSLFQIDNPVIKSDFTVDTLPLLANFSCNKALPEFII